MKARFCVLIGLTWAAGACGNYSNEDVDYQLALPEATDVSAKLPAQQMQVADSAEYYALTRKVVSDSTQVMDAFLGIIDKVRAVAPSQRSVDHRMWGPFKHEKDSRWDMSVTMDRRPDADTGFRFDYAVTARLRAPQAVPLHLITGHFSPSGSARRGSGELILDLKDARAAGYPVAEFAELLRLSITYQTREFPIAVDQTWWTTTFGDTPTAQFSYREGQDGTGSLTFRHRVGDPALPVLAVQSRWQGAGAGRADATIVGGPYDGIAGIDCWGPDTRATYSARPWEKDPKKLTGGDAASCIFAAP